VSPIADNEHQEFGGDLREAIKNAVVEARPLARCFQGTNVSDRADDWFRNFRIPDVAIFLPGNQAIDRGSHWQGGPDFAVEILSRGDRAIKKPRFYASVGVRELLFVVRKPWRLELRKRDGEGWATPIVSSLDDPQSIRGEVLGVTLRLVPGPRRPRVEASRDDGRVWLA